MMHSMGIGAQYDMREFEFAGDTPVDNKDNQVLFGVRAESDYDLGDMDMKLCFEYYNNFGQKADSEVNDRIKAITAVVADETATGGLTQVYSNIQKASFVLSFGVTDV